MPSSLRSPLPAEPRRPLVDLALLLLRLTLGLSFMAHGSQKLFGAFGGRGLEAFTASVAGMGFHPPQLFALLAALSEFGGGLLVTLGAATGLGAFAILFTMIIAIWKVTFTNGYFTQNKGFEYNLLILVVCAALILTGPGRWAVWPWRRPRYF